MARTRIIQSLRLDKIAAVDRPCQQHAKMTIMKRAPEEEVDYPKICKAWVSASDGPRPFEIFLRQELQRDHYYSVMEEYQAELCALDNSLRSTLGAQDMDQDAKLLAMRESIEAFMTSVRAKYPQASADVTKAVNIFADVSKQGDGDMPTIEELSSQIEALTKSVQDITAERDAEVAKREAAETLAKMTDEEKEFLKGKDGEEAKAFMAMNAEQRKAKMKKAAEADETLEVDGSIVKKSVVGETTFEMLVKMHKKQEDLAKAQKKDADAAAIAKAEQRASTEFAHLPGTVAERGAMLKALGDIQDENVRKSFEAVFTTAEGLAKMAFEQVGHQGGTISKADETQFKEKVAEIAKRDGISTSEAMVKAASEYPDLHKAYAGTAAN